jgi:transposase, IS30 family
VVHHYTLTTTGMTHIQFNRDRRVELAILLNAQKNQSQCAKILGMSRPNVCLEINRNKDPDGMYRGGHAHKRYLERRREAKRTERKIENDITLQSYIVEKLKTYWSPEQITGRLKKEKKHSPVSHETIYQFIYTQRPDLVKYLRHQKTKYRKKHGSWTRIEANKAMKIKRITERPLVVEERSRIGDWEGDTVVGKEKVQRILTYVERKSGYAMAEKLDVVTAEIIQKKTILRFKRLPQNKQHTLTRDNGVEFGDYDRMLEARTNLEVFRATPYHSWERGTNENWNGLLRQFFPKGMYFATITQYHVDRAVKLLNDRPRKRHNYSTSTEIFRGCIDSD